METTLRDKDIILVIGSGARPYREYLLAGIVSRCDVVLLDAAPISWQEKYVIASATVPMLDRARLVPDREGLLVEARKAAASYPISGVVTYDETLVVTASMIAEELELPGLTLAGVDNCRNKHRTRVMLTDAALPQPSFALVDSLGEAKDAAERIGYPVILKPRGMGASIGVTRADDVAVLEESYLVSERATHGGAFEYEGGVLVEEMLTGPEISVDGAVRDGKYEPFFLARKKVGIEPYFEEIGHTVEANDTLLEDEALRAMLAEAHSVLGLRNGITHTEVKLSPSGNAIVEVNARLGGDLIPYLGKLATGIDPGAVAAELAVNRQPDLTRTISRTTGIAFAYPPEDCVVEEIVLPAAGSLPGLLESLAMASPGDTVLLPPKAHVGRYAYVIAEGRDRAECEANLSVALEAIELKYRPVVND